MKISVITPALNAEATIERTIRSVLAQETEGMEYLIVDGGSTDRTLQIVERFAPDGISWISEPDRGIADAFNKGIARTSGEIVGIINADDEMWPAALQHVAAAFAADPPPDVVYGNMMFCEPHAAPVVSLPERDLRVIRHRLPLRHPSVFIRRAAYERWGLYDPAYRCAMDYDLLLRFHLRGARFVYVDQILAMMRGGGYSSRHFRRTIREARDISIRHGLPPWRAHAHSWGEVGKTLLKRSLAAAGLGGIVTRYRRHSPRFETVSGGLSASEK